jgi:hypothetical protein
MFLILKLVPTSWKLNIENALPQRAKLLVLIEDAIVHRSYIDIGCVIPLQKDFPKLNVEPSLVKPLNEIAEPNVVKSRIDNS